MKKISKNARKRFRLGYRMVENQGAEVKAGTLSFYDLRTARKHYSRLLLFFYRTKTLSGWELWIERRRGNPLNRILIREKSGRSEQE